MSTTSTRQGKVLANTFIKTYVSYLYEVRSGTCLGLRVALSNRFRHLHSASLAIESASLRLSQPVRTSYPMFTK